MTSDQGQRPIVVAHQVTKRFGPLRALNSVSLSIAPGAVQCIIGPSGSGKSTFLRCLNQLETIDAGAILIDGELSAIAGSGKRCMNCRMPRLPARGWQRAWFSSASTCSII